MFLDGAPMREKVIIRPHQVPALVALVDRGHHTDAQIAKYGPLVVRNMLAVISMIASDPKTLVYMGIDNASICDDYCLHKSVKCDVAQQAVRHHECMWHHRLFGYPTISDDGYTIAQLREACEKIER
jgi:hypothetical protein